MLCDWTAKVSLSNSFYNLLTVCCVKDAVIGRTYDLGFWAWLCFLKLLKKKMKIMIWLWQLEIQ